MTIKSLSSAFVFALIGVQLILAPVAGAVGDAQRCSQQMAPVVANTLPAAQGGLSWKKPLRLLGHIVPVLPLMKTFKDKNGRFFVFVESPFVTGLPSTFLSVVATKVMFWSFGAAFLGGQALFPDLISFDTFLKSIEVWILYQGVNLARNGVAIDPSLSKNEKYYLNIYYSIVGYGLGTQIIKPSLGDAAQAAHDLAPGIFSEVKALAPMTITQRVSEVANAIIWPFFSQKIANEFVVPLMYGRYPKKDMLDKINAPGRDVKALLREQQDKVIKLKEEQKAVEAQWQALPTHSSVLAWFKGKAEREQLKKIKEKRIEIKRKLQEARSLKRWILFLTKDVAQDEAVPALRRAAFWTQKTMVSTLVAVVMQSIYWCLRTFIVGDATSKTPGAWDRVESKLEIAQDKVDVALESSLDGSGDDQAQMDDIARASTDVAQAATALMETEPKLEQLDAVVDQLNERGQGAVVEISEDMSHYISTVQGRMGIESVETLETDDTL